MRSIRRISKLAAGIIVGVVLSSAASAQFGGFYPGLVNLPPDDFVWNWGRYAGETGSRQGMAVARHLPFVHPFAPDPA